MSLFNKVTKSFQWGDKTVVMETGEVARQANGAVLVDIDGTVILATVVASKSAKPGQDFFPLTVDYIREDLRRGQDPRQLLQARSQAQRTRNADQPPDRPSDPPRCSPKAS
jgi:polyribonucleotide nucleotidyltransferase